MSASFFYLATCDILQLMEESLRKPERFQRRIVASFTKTQLESIQEWAFNVDKDGLDEAKDLREFIDIHEPDLKKALRLHYGISLITSIYKVGNTNFDGLQQAVVWKTGSGDKDLVVEWKYYASKFIAPTFFQMKPRVN